MIDIYELPISQLIQHPDNPRKDLGDLEELSESIRTNGIRQNLTVVAAERVEGVTIPEDGEPHYVVVIGHRRLAAAKLAGLSTVPCAVEIMDRKEQLSTMLLENMQRSDLTVYEQAWGFQQMSLLGCTVDEISTKSGFSKSTVRRRLKMAELDQTTLKEVSTGRQLSLADFDRLAEIEDVAERNKVLASIGTNDFNSNLNKAMNAQKRDQKLPLVKKWLKEKKAKQIKSNERYSSKYTGYGCRYTSVYIPDWGEKNNQPPKVTDKQIYYWLDDYYITFYQENQGATREKKTREQLDREKLARQVKTEIRKISAEHYQLRKDFIDRLTVTKSNREAVLMGGILIGLYYAHGRSVNHSDVVTRALGLSDYEYNTSNIVQAIGKVTDGGHNKELVQAIYGLYSDSESNWFAFYMDMTGYVPYWDKERHNTKLTLLYNWLISLGYEMSTEEAAMMDGSHELYHKGGK